MILLVPFHEHMVGERLASLLGARYTKNIFFFNRTHGRQQFRIDVDRIRLPVSRLRFSHTAIVDIITIPQNVNRTFVYRASITIWHIKRSSNRVLVNNIVSKTNIRLACDVAVHHLDAKRQQVAYMTWDLTRSHTFSDLFMCDRPNCCFCEVCPCSVCTDRNHSLSFTRLHGFFAPRFSRFVQR